MTNRRDNGKMEPRNPLKTQEATKVPRFCPKCGAVIDTGIGLANSPATPTALPRLPPPPPMRAPQSVAPSSALKLAVPSGWYLAAGAGALLIVVATVWFFSGDRDADRDGEVRRLVVTKPKLHPIQKMTGRKVALFIGVNEYDKRGFASRPLSFAERDADELNIEFKKHGFEVQLLKGSLGGNKRATKANILAAIEMKPALDVVAGFARIQSRSG